MSALRCWNCGAGLDAIPLPISRHANCPACYAELHCCKLCTHFDPKRPAQCTEDRAEPPNNKAGANFCEWFAPRGGVAAAMGNAADVARAKLDALFTPASREGATESPQGGSALSPAERAAAELERLFGARKPKPPSA